LNSQPENNLLNTGGVIENASTPASELDRSKEVAQKTWLALAALAVALAGAAYLFLGEKSGSPISVAPKAGEVSSSSTATSPTKTLKALSDEQLERMVEQATSQTQKEPKNASAWGMLAHSYEMLGKFTESTKAYSRLAQLLPKDAQVLADYADVLAVVNGRSFKGEPFELLKRALALDSKNAKALLLTGVAYIEEQDYAKAILHFEKARSASKDATVLRQIDDGIAQAKSLSGDPSVATAAPILGKASTDVASGAAAQVSGRVWLAEDLRAKAPAQGTLFLFARPADGSRMPVALLRKKVSDLPMNFTLDDSMAMVPNMGLSKLSTVIIVARISAKGNVTPSAGDLEGVSAPVPVGTKNLKLEITEVLK
jgi:cytochrome c-type biogenesis protein CcmH